ncbi:hypothetical protein ACQU0X_24110 [Pseudovibrio ascidiaceicola]|uniref:DUF5983 family protein n=1 Tax=Pseudovibrio ascidiaceicola TaxID=285279 RepID=UPI003D368A0B
MPDNVRNFLDLSTGHLMTATRELLDAQALSITTYPNEYGWLVRVPSEDSVLDLKSYPQDLLECMALARKKACDYILFDRDAGTDVDLMFYEDDHTTTVRVQISEIVEYHFDMPVTQEQLNLVKAYPDELEDHAKAYFAEVGAKPEWVVSVHDRSVNHIDISRCRDQS